MHSSPTHNLRDIDIGTMTRAEAEQIFAMACAENWNPGTYDFACAWEYDPDAFIALRLRGEMIAGGSIFRHTPSFGFMGLFIVNPRYRGLGLGRQLWRERLERLQARLAPDAMIAMDGVFEMERFYTSGGFKPCHETARYQGVARAVPAATVDPSLLVFGDPGIDALLSLDRSYLPYDRTGLLKLWLAQPQTLRAGAFRDGELVGFGLARPAATGFKIGPLIAEDQQVARALLADLIAKVEGQQIQIDVPGPNIEGSALASACGLVPVFGCRRMYFGRSPDQQLSAIYASMSLEFG